MCVCIYEPGTFFQTCLFLQHQGTDESAHGVEEGQHEKDTKRGLLLRVQVP